MNASMLFNESIHPNITQAGDTFLKRAALSGLLCGAYLLAGKLGLSFAYVHSSASAIWPPAGIALAAFLLLGKGVWPGIFLGAFLVNISTAGSALTSLAIASGNTLEGLIGAALVHRYANGPAAFRRPRDIFRFVALAALVSTTLSPTIGVTSLVLGGFAAWAHYAPIWLTWWLGDMAGVLILAPVLVLLSEGGLPRWNWRRGAEAALLLIALAMASYIVFGGALASSAKNLPLDFIFIPLLLWTAFRFSQGETAAVTLLLAAAALWGTLRGFGPFAVVSRNESLLLLQSFMAVTSVVGITLSAVLSERTRAASLMKMNEALQIEISASKLSEEELARSNAELNLFASVASHELQEPLRKLTMFSDLLKSGVGTSEEERAQYLERMQDAAKRMQKLVDSILNLSRVTTNAKPLELIDLNEIAREIASDFNYSVEKTGGKIEWAPLPRVKADPDQMRQLLVNLVSNAYKFRKKDVPLKIVFSTKKTDNGFVEISIQDNGIGFEPQYAQRIFRPFERLNRRTDYEGSGIGLAICQRICLRHGGAITANSKPGEGSLFTVTLPAHT